MIAYINPSQGGLFRIQVGLRAQTSTKDKQKDNVGVLLGSRIVRFLFDGSQGVRV